MARKNGLAGNGNGKGEELIRGWEASGLTQREYCERRGIPMTTFGYYRRLELKNREQGQQREEEEKGGNGEGDSAARVSALLPVTVSRLSVVAEGKQADGGFVLTLRNGRRIEAGWGFGEAELARLVRVAERV